MRLKPHEAQSYRKKALWVSWISIVVTLILAVAAFSKFNALVFLHWVIMYRKMSLLKEELDEEIP